MRLWLLLIVALAAHAQGQEQPIRLDYPHPGDCFTGCPPSDRQVTCWTFGRVDVDQLRCASYCQREGDPPWRPGPIGAWHACSSVAEAGVACNGTIYVLQPRQGWPCDAGTEDGTTDWDGTFYPAGAQP